MLATPAMTGDFQADLETMLPKLRAYAVSLTRNRDRAEDLVQQTVVKSLAGRASFQPDTNFAAWLIRIERNEFISNLRRERPTASYDELNANALSHAPKQEMGLMMRDLFNAFAALGRSQREALLGVAVEGCSYKEIAARSAVSVGTVKSRIFRARTALAASLAGVAVGDAPLSAAA